MSLDYRLTIDTKFWDALEASAGFIAAFNAGRRLKASESARAREVIMRAPDDYPQVRFSISGGSLARDAPRTFAMNSPTYSSTTCDLVIPAVVRAKVTVVHDKPKITAQTPIETLVEQALMAKWPHLGITTFKVDDFVLDEWRRTDRADDKGVMRTFSEANMIVNIRPKLSQLAG